jgi:hypothetical protein
MSTPKLFVSYCWSTPTHEQWVVDLAGELMQSGVEVVLDKWDLREGHDAVAFMEKMVTDATITKVVIVCDKAYADKADGRKGGVGTETQIISREVYERTDQSKFVVVVAERDDAGKPYLPTYYKSRIYIDLSESDRYAENFERLVRWIFDKPIYVKPEIGRPPSFVTDTNPTTLGTSALAKRATEGVRGDKGYAKGALDEYLETFALNVERFRIDAKDGELDELVVNAIDATSPSRNEFLQVLGAFVQYSEPGSTAKTIHRFFESLLTYYSRPEGQTSWNEVEFDHFKFFTHELFLYALSAYLRAEDYSSANLLLTEPYYLPKNIERGRNTSSSFSVIRDHLRSLDYRNQHRKLNRLSLRADLLEQRSKSSGIPFRHVMQADFVCFMRAELSGDRWWPETLLYATHHYGPFELFARATSKGHLSRILPVLGAASTATIKAKLEEFANDRRAIPRWQFESFDPAALMGFEQLGTKA